jgi:GTPase SAR1 family protein
MSGKEYYNFLVLGAEATGKTCLCSCFSRGLFLDQHVPTIDVFSPSSPFCVCHVVHLLLVSCRLVLVGLCCFLTHFIIILFPADQDEYKKTITYGTEVDLTIADLGGWFALPSPSPPFFFFFWCRVLFHLLQPDWV